MSRPTPPASREREIYAQIQRDLKRAVEREQSLQLQRRSLDHTSRVARRGGEA